MALLRYLLEQEREVEPWGTGVHKGYFARFAGYLEGAPYTVSNYEVEGIAVAAELACNAGNVVYIPCQLFTAQQPLLGLGARVFGRLSRLLGDRLRNNSTNPVLAVFVCLAGGHHVPVVVALSRSSSGSGSSTAAFDARVHILESYGCIGFTPLAAITKNLQWLESKLPYSLREPLPGASQQHVRLLDEQSSVDSKSCGVHAAHSVVRVVRHGSVRAVQQPQQGTYAEKLAVAHDACISAVVAAAQLGKGQQQVGA